MIKINLPNPRGMSTPEFFAQMRIALKSAEKSYEEMIKGIELTEENNPWISFRMLNELEVLGNFADKIPLATSEDEWQEIYLEIDTL